MNGNLFLLCVVSYWARKENILGFLPMTSVMHIQEALMAICLCVLWERAYIMHWKYKDEIRCLFTSLYRSVWRVYFKKGG